MAKRKGTPIEQWISTGQAAKRLGVVRRHVSRLIEAGEIEGLLVAGHWAVNPDSLDGWERQRKPKQEGSIE